MLAPDVPINALSRNVHSGKFSDLTFSCEGETIQVHKVVVCSQSPVLDRAVSGNFLEATTNVIHMDTFDAETVRRFVAYLYTGSYESGAHSFWKEQHPILPEPSNDLANHGCRGAQPTASILAQSQTIPKPVPGGENPAWDEVRLHMRMSAVADYYDVSALCNLAKTNLQSALIPAGKELGPVEDFLEVVEQAEESNGDASIHKLLAKVAFLHMPMLVRDKEFMARYPAAFDYKLISLCAATSPARD